MRRLDLRCANGHVEQDAVCGVELGFCPGCGKPWHVTWEFGQAPATDVRGSEKIAEALCDDQGRRLRYTSTRDLRRQMKKLGFDEQCGDRVGGARRGSTYEKTIFGYAGQRNRSTPPERARAGEAVPVMKPKTIADQNHIVRRARIP